MGANHSRGSPSAFHRAYVDFQLSGAQGRRIEHHCERSYPMLNAPRMLRILPALTLQGTAFRQLDR